MTIKCCNHCFFVHRNNHHLFFWWITKIIGNNVFLLKSKIKIHLVFIQKNGNKKKRKKTMTSEIHRKEKRLSSENIATMIGLLIIEKIIEPKTLKSEFDLFV